MSWCTIESDPGVFTELIENIGVKNVQVAEIYDLEKSTFDKLKPVFGLIFLFKWDQEIKDTRQIMSSPPDDLFFAQQTVPNACGTQAILSVLLNRYDIELGDTLNDFKGFAMSLPPDMRGEIIGQNDVIRAAHNSFARAEPFVAEEKETSADDEAYHFVAYVHVNGVVYELDGLKRGPIKVGECDETKWLDVATPAIQERMNQYNEKEIRFNLLAVIKNRQNVLTQQLEDLKTKLTKIQQIQSSLAAGSAPMHTDEDLPTTEDECKAAILSVETEIKDVEQDIENEKALVEKYKVENVRRKHNYVPFVFHLLKSLAEKGKLEQLEEQGRKANSDAIDRAKKAKASAKGSSTASSAPKSS